MYKFDNQFKGIPPAVIFMPQSYRSYMGFTRKLMLLNIKATEDYCSLNEAPYDLGMQLRDDLKSFKSLCVDLMNTDCQHGFYRPSQVDVRRLLAWLDVVQVLNKRLAEKITGVCEGVHS